MHSGGDCAMGADCTQAEGFATASARSCSDLVSTKRNSLLRVGCCTVPWRRVKSDKIEYRMENGHLFAHQQQTARISSK